MVSSGWRKALMQDKAGGISLPFLPFLLVIVLVALPVGIVVGIFDPLIGVAIVGGLGVAIILMLRQDELAAGTVIVVHIYVDWYLGMRVAALAIVLVLLAVFFLARSPQHPWITPRAFWLWAVFLALAILPATRGVTWPDSTTYYLNIVLGPLITFWLGTVLAQNVRAIRLYFQILAAIGALLAIVTLIQATTGTLLFASSGYDQYLAQVSNFELTTSTGRRAGAFFTNPDWNGTFFAIMLFIPMGLFFESSSFLGKALYLVEALAILPALFFTYSIGALVGMFAGLVVFIVLLGQTRNRIILTLLTIAAALMVIMYYPVEVNLQIQHALSSGSLSSRLAAWQTAWQVIQAFPLTGIGLGLFAYLARAEPYRVLAQYKPLAHPHNAYLELGAMAGLPLLLVFIALLLFAFWLALRNWIVADAPMRALLGGGIAAVVALSVNSMSINGWTLAPLAAIGWLILGIISSSLLAKNRTHLTTQEQDNESIGVS